MSQYESRRRADRFVALRVNTLVCWLVLTPVVLWSAVLGMAALVVGVFWAGTLGDRSANAWASARARGLSARAAASVAGWWRAAAVLVLAVTSAVLTAAVLRQLSPMGDWLGAPGVAKPVVGALSLVLGGATPGIAAVVVSARSDALAGVDEGEDEEELPAQRRAREGLTGGQRAAGLLAAVALGVVNVVVMASVTPLGEWVREGTGRGVVAVAVLALAFATPTAAVWYANRTRGALRNR